MTATAATSERQSLKELARRVLERIDQSSSLPEAGSGVRLDQGQLERRRDAAAWQVWDRLQKVFLLAGQPDAWITRQVRVSEGAVEQLWLSVRQLPEDDVRFYEVLRRWEQDAMVAITRAASKEVREKDGD